MQSSWAKQPFSRWLVAVQPMATWTATAISTLCLVANGGLPRVLRNNQQTGHHWLRIQLKGGPLESATPSERKCGWTRLLVRQSRCVTATRSYLSQCELPLTFGLGPAAEPVTIDIAWPDGQLQKAENLAVDKLHVVEKRVNDRRCIIFCPIIFLSDAESDKKWEDKK